MHGQTAFGVAFVVAGIIIGTGALFAWANHDIIERTVRQGLKLQQQQGELPPDLQNADIDKFDLEDREIAVELPSGILLRNDIALLLSNLWYLWAPVVLLICFGAAAFLSSSSKRG